MTHAIELLETEKKQLEIVLSEWELDHYPEARKERDKRLNDINQALALIQAAKATYKIQQTLFG